MIPFPGREEQARLMDDAELAAIWQALEAARQDLGRNITAVPGTASWHRHRASCQAQLDAGYTLTAAVRETYRLGEYARGLCGCQAGGGFWHPWDRRYCSSCGPDCAQEQEPDPERELIAELAAPAGLSGEELDRLVPYSAPGSCLSCHTPLNPPQNARCAYCAALAALEQPPSCLPARCRDRSGWLPLAALGVALIWASVALAGALLLYVPGALLCLAALARLLGWPR